MRTRSNGEARERLRQLLQQHARRLGLTPGAVDALVRQAVIERWEAGDTIVPADDGHDLVTMLVIGAAKIVCRTRDGRPAAVALAAPGQVIAAGSPLDATAAAQRFAAIACDPLSTTVARWGSAVVADVLGALPPAHALQLVAYTWRAFSGVLAGRCELLALPLRDRVLAVLRPLARDFGMPYGDAVRIELRLTHADLAGLAGGSRANVTRALDQLRRAGLVAVARHRLVLTATGVAALGLRHEPAAAPMPQRRAV